MINQREIEGGLRSLGLKDGDIVMLHSALSSLGPVAGGADTVIAAFLAVLGESGTLAVPTFGSLGIIPEIVKARPDAVQSHHPMAGVAAVGGAAEELCRDHWKADLAHGPDTPYMRIAQMGGAVCLMGVDLDRTTLMHTPEELLRLPYLKTTQVKTFDTPEGQVKRSWPFFPGPHRDFIGLDCIFRERGKVRVGRIGDSVVRVMAASDMVEIGKELGEKDPAFALCNNPNCEACVRQRADIRRERHARFPFSLAASASLAGRYVEEIIDNCAAAGVDAVELDMLRGRPLGMLPAEAVSTAIVDLQAAGCPVCALRLTAVGARTADLIAVAAQNGVPRVVVPLSHGSDGDAACAAKAGVRISFFNTALDGGRVSEILLDLKAKGFEVGFTFNAANFARAGELPFLKSYKQKLKRFIDQLDVADALYDGTAQPLACGNAEVKEMLSILCASSFAGWVVLGSGNRPVGDLRCVADRFDELLNAI